MHSCVHTKGVRIIIHPEYHPIRRNTRHNCPRITHGKILVLVSYWWQRSEIDTHVRTVDEFVSVCGDRCPVYKSVKVPANPGGTVHVVAAWYVQVAFSHAGIEENPHRNTAAGVDAYTRAEAFPVWKARDGAAWRGFLQLGVRLPAYGEGDHV